MRVVFELVSWLILLFMLVCISFNVKAQAKYHQIKVVVIDTGLDTEDIRLSSHICEKGNIDITEEGLKDLVGHGTHVVGLIEIHAQNADYCISMIKYASLHYDMMGAYLQALQQAIAQNPDIINLSLSGKIYTKEEKDLICDHPNITFVVAAGNEGIDIDKDPVYPASLGCKNIRVVGGLDKKGYRYSLSNYGKNVKYYEDAVDVLSTLPNGEEGSKTGTSMSTAIYTGKLVYEKYLEELSLKSSN